MIKKFETECIYQDEYVISDVIHVECRNDSFDGRHGVEKLHSFVNTLNSLIEKFCPSEIIIDYTFFPILNKVLSVFGHDQLFNGRKFSMTFSHHLKDTVSPFIRMRFITIDNHIIKEKNTHMVFDNSEWLQ